MRRRYLLLLFISICLTLVVPAIFGGGEVFRQVLHLSWPAVLLLLALSLVGWGFNAARVQLLLGEMRRPVGIVEGALITIAAEFAAAATPAASGMPATYIFLFSRTGVRLGKAVGLVMIIILLDVLYFCTAMFLAALVMLVVRNPFGTQLVIGVALLLVGGAAVLIWLLVRYFRPMLHGLSRLMARFAWLARRRYRLARGAVDLLHALRAFRSLPWPRRAALYLFSVGYWLPRYLVLVVAVSLVARHVPVAYLFLIQGLLNLGGQMLVIPAGGGGVDAGYLGLMAAYLPHANAAFTLIIWRSFTFYWYLIVGGPIFLLKTGREARALLRASRPAVR